MSKPKPLQPGDDVPEFSTVDQQGKAYGRDSLLGTRYLLYFYPRDLTPGCTTQACDLRDVYDQFSKHQVQIFGISPDDEKSHQKFIEKYELPFSLLVDTGHKIACNFGVWGEKKFMGRTYDGVYRTSFLVGPDGKIEQTYENVKVAVHAQQVLDNLQG